MSRFIKPLTILVVLTALLLPLDANASAAPVNAGNTPTPTPTGSITIKQALDQGLISLTLTANGQLFYHSPLHYHIENLSSHALQIEFPVGQTFVPEDPGLQILMLGQDLFKDLNLGQNAPNQWVVADLNLKPHQVLEGDLPTFCINESRHAPSQGAIYKLGPMAHGKLLSLAKAIEAHSAQGHLGAQLAVWALTDNFNISDLNATPSPDQPSSLADTIRPLLCLAQDDVVLGQQLLQESNAGVSLYQGENPLTSFCQSQGIPSLSQIVQRLKVLGIEAALILGAGALGCVAVVVGLIVLIVRLARRPK